MNKKLMLIFITILFLVLLNSITYAWDGTFILYIFNTDGVTVPTGSTNEHMVNGLAFETYLVKAATGDTSRIETEQSSPLFRYTVENFGGTYTLGNIDIILGNYKTWNDCLNIWEPINYQNGDLIFVKVVDMEGYFVGEDIGYDDCSEPLVFSFYQEEWTEPTFVVETLCCRVRSKHERSNTSNIPEEYSNDRNNSNLFNNLIPIKHSFKKAREVSFTLKNTVEAADFRLSRTSWDVEFGYSSNIETMVDSEVCVIMNLDSVEMDLSLSVFETRGDWEPSYVPSRNGFVLRALFQRDTLFYETFHPALDYVKSTPTQASEYIYGFSGFDIPPGASENLWLQVIEPLYSTELIIDVTLILTITARTEYSASSQEFYIYLHTTPEDIITPPDTIKIIEANSERGHEYIKLEADRPPIEITEYRIYRDTKPLFWISSLHDSLRLPETATTRYFTDMFYDELWFPFGSKGVGDPETNLFYVMTTYCSLWGSGCESSYPSKCAGEFDFKLESPDSMTHYNHVVYALVRSEIRDAGNTGASFAQTIRGCYSATKWDAAYQCWTFVAHLASFPYFDWITYYNVELLHPYVVEGDSLDSIWSMQVPGIVPPDPHFDMIHNTYGTSWNHISLPFLEQQIADIQDGIDLAIDITDCVTIKRWDAEKQGWALVAIWLMSPPFYPSHYCNYEKVRAGYPYMVWVNSSLIWPPSP